MRVNTRAYPTLHLMRNSLCRVLYVRVCPFVFLHLAIILSALLRITANRIGDVMVSELASSVVDREFEPRSCHSREVWSSIKNIVRSRN